MIQGQIDEDDEDLNEFQELLDAQKSGKTSGADIDLMTRGKLFMHDLVHRAGFFGILAAASIPNPLLEGRCEPSNPVVDSNSSLPEVSSALKGWTFELSTRLCAKLLLLLDADDCLESLMVAIELFSYQNV